MWMRDYINQGWLVHYAYQHGAEDMPANYPVPAIPLETYIAPYGISVNRKHEWLFHRRMLRYWSKEHANAPR